MNREEILAMPAGRDLDALIAENVMGWKDRGIGYSFEDNINGYECVLYIDKDKLPHYSTDIAAAWQVIEWLEKNTTEKYNSPSLFSVPHGWSMVLYEKRDNHAPAWLDAFAPTAPLAICRAALLAVMESQS